MKNRIHLCYAAPMAHLVFMKRGIELMRHVLTENALVIGRGEACDLSLPDANVSLRHARVFPQNETWNVEDETDHGLLVNGSRVPRAQLSHNDSIQFGPWTAIVKLNATEEVEHAETEIAAHAKLHADKSKPQPFHISVSSNDNSKRYSFEPGVQVSIGRAETSDIAIDDPQLSATHVRIECRPNGFLVIDQNSSNGTFMGGIRIFEAELPDQAQLSIGRSTVTLSRHAKAQTDTPSMGGILGQSTQIKSVLELIRKVAASQAPVIILGESGTGKELIARALHDHSKRSKEPFIPVNCAALTKELIESELFGHEKGAFTGATNSRKGAFEEANKGTLFLDELGELPLDLQAKLLRALESGEIRRVGTSTPVHVDVRVVCATNRNLIDSVRSGQFREDLYFRLAVVPLHLPPLRARREDIPILVEHFVTSHAPQKAKVGVSKEASQKLLNHAWPGNVRELRNVVTRALLLRAGPHIDADDVLFDSDLQKQQHVATGHAFSEKGMGTFDELMYQAEKNILEETLRRFPHSREQAMDSLQIPRSTFFKKLKAFGLTSRGDEADDAIQTIA